MAIYLSKKHEKAGFYLLIWQIDESLVELQAMLSSEILTDAELAETRHPQKQLEFFASRIAIKALADQLEIVCLGIKKDEYGKPYMVGNNWQMSLTHSQQFIAVAMHPYKPIGIDLEKPSEKMWKILPRLFSQTEIERVGNNLDKLSIYWSAKEALYKLYGKRKVDFRENLLLQEENETLIGYIDMPDYKHKHEVWVEEIGNYFLTIAL